MSEAWVSEQLYKKIYKTCIHTVPICITNKAKEARKRCILRLVKVHFLYHNRLLW